jgi:glycosyltransferase involved in cell wall biosynthesis
MHIGIIIEPYEETEPSGLAYVTAEYTRGLIEHATDCRIILYSKQSFRLFPLPDHVQHVIIPKSFLGKNWYFLKQYVFDRRAMPDVLVFNMPLLPLILPRSVATVIFCHEVLFESDIAAFSTRVINAIWRMLAHYTVSHARVICAATHAIAQEIEHTYHVPQEVVRVIHHGIRNLPKAIPVKNDFGAPYFLFTGRTKYKKNMHGIIEGFVRFKERTGSPHLLCLAGKTKDTPYLLHWLGEAQRRGFGDAIMRTGYLSEPELLSVIQNATALVFCSLAEGFGLPVPEAMSMGVPVITSSIPVLAEVAGDAALCVDPYDPDAIARAMEIVATNTEVRDTLIQKGYARARQFGWPQAHRAFTEAVLSACPQ